jgi:hypothetical protein
MLMMVEKRFSAGEATLNYAEGPLPGLHLSSYMV